MSPLDPASRPPSSPAAASPGDPLAANTPEGSLDAYATLRADGPPAEREGRTEAIPAQMFGTYRVLEQLGSGGMGIVYVAEDVRLQRRVALKVMRPDVAAGPMGRERFLREARLAAAVEHEHIITIYAVDETPDGSLYLAMPLLRGETLDERLQAGPLPLPELLRIGGEIVAGLAAAHAHGLIHRDVKPSNIFLAGGKSTGQESLSQMESMTGYGLVPTVKILDFGLARPIGNSDLSMPGGIVGTPAYMSPEQARGEELDARSDLFSLGSVLYRMATGRQAFKRDDALAVMYAVQEDHPPHPRELRPELPEALDELIMRLLSKDRSGRPSAVELGNALAEMARQLAPAQRPALMPTPTAPAAAPVRRDWARPLRETLAYFKRPGWRGALIGIACALVAWGVSRYHIFLRLEDWLQDGCFAFRAAFQGARPTSTRVLVVGLDDRSLSDLHKPLLYGSPEIAEVVKFLSASKAAAIGLDLLVPQDYSQIPALQRGAEGDAFTLGQAILEAGSVVLPEWKQDAGWLRPALQWQFKARLKKDANDFGFVNLTEDDDYFLRRQQLLALDPRTGQARRQFALALVARARDCEVEASETGLILDRARVPLDDDQLLQINFVGPPRTIPEVSFRDVLAAARGERKLPDDVKLAGAVVILGTTARSQQDYHATPFSNSYWRPLGSGPADLMSGSEIHANIVATLMDRAYIHTPPWPASLALLVGFGAALGRVFARVSLGWGLLVACVHHWGWKFLCLGLFTLVSLRLEILPMLVLGVLVYGAIFLQRWRLLRRMLGVVKSEEIARLLEDDPNRPDLRGEDRVVTVLYADLRGFHAFCERSAAREIVALLNAYFSAIVPIIEKHGGTLNQYLGDGVMVLFGAPTVQRDHALRAVQAAREMLQRVRELRPQWAELNFPDLRISVGIHTGPVVLGTVGSPSRLDYAAIGDATDTAVWIRGKTKDFGADILISGQTYRELPGKERTALGCSPEPRPVEIKSKKQMLDLHAVRIEGVTIL